MSTDNQLAVMASRLNVDQNQLLSVLNSTVMPAKVKVTPEQYTAFLMVANEYRLNPITKEIYAFPAKTGGIQAMVSIDGWMRIINSHEQFDGMQFRDALDSDGKLISITCSIHRKDRQHPIEVTEYMAECRRGTAPWQQWPARMLRHKAAIQCARYAFGFSNIYDQDELERMEEAQNPEKVVTGSDSLNTLLNENSEEIEAAKKAISASDTVQRLEKVGEIIQNLPDTAERRQLRVTYGNKLRELREAENASAQ